MLRTLTLMGFFLLLAGKALPAAANPVRTENVETHLRAELPAAVPGQELWLALTQRIRPGWHTYWINPGDSGLPTTIAWTLPQGWQAGPIVWPAPERFPIGPLVNFGYKDTAHLLTRVTVPDTARPGESVTLTAAVDWLVCEDICIPESGTLSLTLPVAAGPATPTPEAAALFAEARAALPRPNPVAASLVPGSGQHSLRIGLPQTDDGRVTDAFFFPEDWKVTPAAGVQTLAVGADGLRLTLPKAGEIGPGPVRGVLRLTHRTTSGTVQEAFAIEAAIVAGSAADSAGPVPAGTTVAARETAGLGLAHAMLLALLGGIVLNLMPCVFPVLSMKALALVRHEAEHAKGHGLAYTAGVLACFLLVAGVLIGLRAAGEQIGWGFQLQTPWVVALLAYVMFLLGLSLSGLFSLGGGMMGMGQGLAARGGYAGSFFTGALATLVATPCTAPFMGAAVGFALLQPWAVSLAVFLALGFGMALPFLLLCFSPSLLRRMPRPGLWMERVKQGLAFPLYATAVWLVWVLAIQVGPTGAALVLGGMVLLAFAVWLLQMGREGRGGWSALARIAAALAFAGVVVLSGLAGQAGPPAGGTATAGGGGTGAEVFSESRVAELVAEGRPVFVNFTAAWCITCLVNEQTSLSSAAVRSAMEARGIVYLKADWTNRDAAIARVLQSFGRSGVPLYLLYAPGQSEPLVLPQILSESAVLEAFDRIGGGPT